MKLPRPSGVCISEKPIKCLKDVTLLKRSVVTLVELVGVPRPYSGAGHRVGDPKKSAEFLLHVLKKPESNVELKDLDVESLDTEHI